MLRCGSQIRLTQEERQQLMALVVDDPGPLRHVNELEHFVVFHLDRLKTLDSPVAEFTRRRLQALLPSPRAEGCASCPVTDCRRRA